MKGTVMACGLVVIISFALTGCATVTSPDQIIAGLLDGVLKPKPRKAPAPSTPKVLALDGRPVSTHNPRFVQASPPAESPATTPPALGSVPSPPLAPPEPAPSLGALPTRTASEVQPAPAAQTSPVPPEPVSSSASTRVLERILEAYRGFQYETALTLALDYVESTVPSDQERAAAAFIGAAAAYVMNRPAVMDDLLGEAIRIAPYLKPDPNTLPKAVCLRHHALSGRKGE